MKSIKAIVILIILLFSQHSFAQDAPGLGNYWQIGFGLGELPMGGSFKPSITIGYHFNDKLYAGIIYQFKDQISRNEASINAKSSGLDGLVSATEEVAQRFLFQLRYTPVKNAPYLSAGFVFNGMDSEQMLFDDRSRTIAGENYDGTIIINQTRPAGWGFAMGIGYQYNFKNGFSTGLEWTPACFQYPVPSYAFEGTVTLSENAQNTLVDKMNNEFNSSVTNMYKVFHVGVAYRFQ